MGPTPICTSRFSWHASEPTFTAEATDLQLGNAVFTLVSARTGRAVICALNHTERDREGDLLWEDYVPVNAHGPLPNPPFTVRIYND